jgi:predicted lipoprotein with Yx(FWY)xxD motif
MSQHRFSLRIAGTVAALALTIAACGGDSVVGNADEQADTTAPSETTTTPAGGGEATTTVVTAAVDPDAGATITTVDSPFGAIVANRDGRTLYVFDNDTDGVSNCADQCAVNWPPVLAAGSPIAAGSIDGTKLATITRADGGTQVTYFGRPLYHFAADAAPGDVLGQGVGGTWHVLDPTGAPVLDAAPGADAPTVSIAETAIGDVLTGAPDGLTLYLFLGDEAGRPAPTCTGTCADNWPPLLLESSGGDTETVTAGAGIDVSLLGNVAHPEGGTQVTYNSWPLYFFGGDKAPGDTTGQGVGGKWFVVDVDGQPAGPDAPVITSEPAGAPPATGNASILLDETSLGTIITDFQGLTLYAFETERPDLPTPACYDACAEAWPPFATDPAVFAPPDLDQDLIGTVQRTDGILQVTYNDWPLYYFAGDEARGDVNGQGLGGVWFVLGPDGKLVKP